MKIYLFRGLFVVLFSFLLVSNNLYGMFSNGEKMVENSVWSFKSYAPELYLLSETSTLLLFNLETTADSCDAVTLPFTEGFNLNSTTFKCWSILDNNKDATAPTGNNIWKQFASTPYEGDRAMYFYGVTSVVQNDDWLISPTIKMDGSLYAITYYYKTAASYDNNFEVVLLKGDIEPTSYKKVLEPSEKRNTTVYLKKTLYVEDEVGDVNIAWHVTAKGGAIVFIDLVKIEKIDCKAPEAMVLIKDIETNKAKAEWTDPYNHTSWEYYVQLPGSGLPQGSGFIEHKMEANLSRLNAGGNLTSNTEYELYIRAMCDNGKGSAWVGPITFKTSCESFTIPFFEGFNTTSASLDCWQIVDNNKDATSPTGNNIWRFWKVGAFEGDQMMYFNGPRTNDDWLISPTLLLDSNKTYRLQYYYKTNSTAKNNFEVLLSTTGSSLDGFKTVLVANKSYSNVDFVQETVFFSGVSIANIAWHITSESGITISLDNITIEEVVNCPEPLNLNVQNIQTNSAELSWTDAFNASNWEYHVQRKGLGQPTQNGTSTSKKEITATQDFEGDSLDPNTEYEFYVRTVCSDNSFSVWAGPYPFRTICGTFTTPFWEGFNANSNTFICWNIIDGNGDSTSPTGNNIWRNVVQSTAYEGSHLMFFFANTTNPAQLPHNDWLISPTITFDANKMYRLKYHYKTASSATYDYEFEVLLSDNGVETNQFKTALVEKKKYEPSDLWKEEYVFIKNISGNVNVAWHVTSPSPITYLYLDNIFIEEVTGCAEPINIEVSNIDTNKATISWQDDMGGENWEYYIQKEGEGFPKTKGVSTNSKINDITTATSGEKLFPNTDYEIYVRTDCGDGTFSIWNGPFKFATSCDVYELPFWEGFNKDSKTLRCWTVRDNADQTLDLGNTWRVTNVISEGDQALYHYGYNSAKTPFNDWLISPTFNLEKGSYVLKFKYRTHATVSYLNEFEVLLSDSGQSASDFDKVLLPSKIYNNGIYNEQVVFFDAEHALTNIAWHITAKNTNYTYLYLDDISIKKASNCSEPYYVKVTEQTDSSIAIEWEQNDGITNWEAVIVEYGKDENSIPVQKLSVQGTPEARFTGLTSGKGYTIYVRAQCDTNNAFSNWSTRVDSGTVVNTNDDCSGVYTIPVNQSLDRIETVSGSILGAKKSALDSPECNKNLINDVWFAFTATSTVHLLSVSDVVAVTNTTIAPLLYGAIYEDNCGSITATNALTCFEIKANQNNTTLTNLIIGQKYYVRLGNFERLHAVTKLPLPDQPDFIFNLCITTAERTPMEISPSGDKYTVDELIKEVLIKSKCDLVSNVNYQVGDGSPDQQSINTLGYFNKANSNFPFNEGIILSTGEVEYAAGPYKGFNFKRGRTVGRWVGDKELRDVIHDAGGFPAIPGVPQIKDMRVTQIEFDFTPIKDSISFEYLFASNSYSPKCIASCHNGALFAAWLIDVETGKGINLAKVTGSDSPIGLETIIDTQKTGGKCKSVNPEYYWNHYENN